MYNTSTYRYYGIVVNMALRCHLQVVASRRSQLIVIRIRIAVWISSTERAAATFSFPVVLERNRNPHFSRFRNVVAPVALLTTRTVLKHPVSLLILFVSLELISGPSQLFARQPLTVIALPLILPTGF